jgi:leucyl/phenylalanyl-tRNA--protein transferase
LRSEELTPWLIQYAYERAAFPMANDDGTVDWYQPHRRALFPIEGVHVSRSLKKTIQRAQFDIRFDTSFESVMRNCLRPDANWINEDLIRSYTQVHFEGWGHCCEAWMDGQLVGGVYGLALGTCFCAESMFHRVTDASKVALWAMVEKCRLLGFTLFDAQIMNPHLRSLGAFEIPNREYERRLEQALRGSTPWSRP